MTPAADGPGERRERPPGRLIAIGASAGGVEALISLVAGLPADLPAAVVVVLHLSADVPSHLAYILAKAGALPATEARDGDLLRPGRILVASPGHHLVVQQGRARLLDGGSVNWVKPAIDPLFQSAAREYGPRLVAVILTGMLNDGSAGLLAVRQEGGVAVVQDPKDAAHAEMPQSALDAAGADYCVPLEEMAPLLVELVHRPPPSRNRRGRRPAPT
jgi:two-component system, chemotaxis family, protein-glutamate methylesterase/glutaminase